MGVENLDILVTGGLGFIGKNFCARVHSKFNNKYIIDKCSYASDLDFFYKKLKPLGWQLIIGDTKFIRSMDIAAKANHLLIINFAAESHVDKSFGNVSSFIDSNILGTAEILELCRLRNARLLHISTDEVYGERSFAKATVADDLRPTNPYSASKAAADLLTQTYINCFKIDAKIMRPNNIYGPRQLVEKVIPKAIQASSRGEVFYLHGRKAIKRHFLHVYDFSDAVLRVISQWEDIDFQVLNVGSDFSVDIGLLVQFIYQQSGQSLSLIEYGPDRPFNDLEYRVDDSDMRSLGWSPIVDFWSALAQMCADRDFLPHRTVG